MSRNDCAVMVALLVGFALSAPVATEQLGFLKHDSKAEYSSFKDPSDQFTLEFPKDWQVVNGAGDVLVTFVEKKNEATISVERFKLNTALAPEDVTDLFAQIETEVLQERQPKATSVTSKVIEQNGAPVIVIDYVRPGIGRPVRARQYSFPVAQVLYRLTCGSSTFLFSKYDAAFTHVAASLKVQSVPKAGVDAR